jgi:cobalt-zinc-cadmium efflux system membrane fusion protein
MNMTNILKHVLYLFVSIAVLVSCTNEPAQNTAEEHHEEEDGVAFTEAQMVTAGIELGSVEEKQISGTIKVNGILDVPPQQLVSISAPLGGFLKNTVLLEGARVKKGQSIATIENIEFVQLQQDYLDAKSYYELAAADYERQQELAKQKINSEKTLQQSRANYSSWQAKYNGLREKLKVVNINPKSVEQGNLSSTINLYSPINGYVTEVNVNIGKFVNPTDVLFEIVDTEHLHAELIVFEKDVPNLKIGQKVRFTLANETEERMATVYLTGREISEERTVQIHCHIDEEDTEMLPGMYLTALVETGADAVPALPDEAVIDYQGRKYIFMTEEDAHADEDPGAHAGETQHHDEGQHFKMVEVQIGSSELGFTEVRLPEGFDKDKRVVVKGAYWVLSAMKNSEEEGGHAH